MLEMVFAVVFLIEYVARIWIAPENPDLGGGWKARLRYALSMPALIDLIALSTLFLTFFGSEGAFLRLFRLARIFMLARLGRYSSALRAIGHALNSRRYELGASLTIAGFLLLVSSTLLYMVEGDIQPDDFGSIPRAMWWSIATLTTVGYGDAFPITPFGKAAGRLHRHHRHRPDRHADRHSRRSLQRRDPAPARGKASAARAARSATQRELTPNYLLSPENCRPAKSDS